MRIDLSTVPSSMETLAAGWSGAVPAPRRKPAPRQLPPPAPRPANYAAAPDPGALQARRDAMKAIARDLPDPARYAQSLPLPVVQALEGARKSYGAWRFADDVHPDVMRWMRAAGLAYMAKDDPCLTYYAQRVRRALQW